MSRRSHHSLDPSDERGTPLTPEAMTKVEFGRHLQRLLHERNWNQSDLSREVEKATGKKMGRDAISTYVTGRSYPTPLSINLLCQAFGITREELFPNAVINAVNDAHPAFEMRVAPGHAGKAWVRLNRMMSFGAATQIANVLQKEDAGGPADAE